MAGLQAEIVLQGRQHEGGAAVVFITDGFEADMLEVHTHLVATLGQRAAFHEHVAVETFADGEFSAGTFAILFLLVSALYALTNVMPPWGAALAISALLAIGGVAAGISGIKEGAGAFEAGNPLIRDRLRV